MDSRAISQPEEGETSGRVGKDQTLPGMISTTLNYLPGPLLLPMNTCLHLAVKYHGGTMRLCVKDAQAASAASVIIQK
jgi:hypothetical protein